MPATTAVTVNRTAVLSLISAVLVALIGAVAVPLGVYVLDALERNEDTINRTAIAVAETQDTVDEVHVLTNSALTEVKEALRLANEQVAAGVADRALLRAELAAQTALIQEMRTPSVEPLPDRVIEP